MERLEKEMLVLHPIFKIAEYGDLSQILAHRYSHIHAQVLILLLRSNDG